MIKTILKYFFLILFALTPIIAGYYVMETVIKGDWVYLMNYSWISLLSLFITYTIYRNEKKKQRKASSFFTGAAFSISIISVGLFFILTNSTSFKIWLIKNEYREGGMVWNWGAKGLFGHSNILQSDFYFKPFYESETSVELFKDSLFFKKFSILCFDKYPDLRRNICCGFGKKNLTALSILSFCAMKYYNRSLEEIAAEEDGMRLLLGLCFAVNQKNYRTEDLPAEIKNKVKRDTNEYLGGLVSKKEITGILSMACHSPDSLTFEDHELLIVNLLYFPGMVTRAETDKAFTSWANRFPVYKNYLSRLNDQRIKLRDFIDKGINKLPIHQLLIHF